MILGRVTHWLVSRLCGAVGSMSRGAIFSVSCPHDAMEEVPLPRLTAPSSDKGRISRNLFFDARNRRSASGVFLREMTTCIGMSQVTDSCETFG